MSGRRVAVVSAGRSDFGHIAPVLKRMENTRGIVPLLLITGSHLENEYGRTEQEIADTGFSVDARIAASPSSDTAGALAQAIGVCIDEFAKAFANLKPHVVLVSGDRFEMFAAAVAAFTSGVILAHVSGGDVTAGALDDGFRHSMTKMAHVHFPSNPLSAARLRQMGEDPARIHVIGEPSLERLATLPDLPSAVLARHLGFDLEKWSSPLIVTVHPETIAGDVETQIANVTTVLAGFDGPVVITAANRDPGGQKINEAFRQMSATRPSVRFVESMGWEMFAALMRHASAMLGNSSSGISEAPSFALPVVNIGHRQDGRLRAANVIDVQDEPAAIASALSRAVSSEFRDSIRGMSNPYFVGNSAERITRVLSELDLSEKTRRKMFVDIPS